MLVIELKQSIPSGSSSIFCTCLTLVELEPLKLAIIISSNVSKKFAKLGHSLPWTSTSLAVINPNSLSSGRTALLSSFFSPKVCYLAQGKNRSKTFVPSPFDLVRGLNVESIFLSSKILKIPLNEWYRSTYYLEVEIERCL